MGRGAMTSLVLSIEELHAAARPHTAPADVARWFRVAVVLIILWLLGLVSSYTMGGLIHVLLVIALVVVLLRVISGRNVS